MPSKRTPGMVSAVAAAIVSWRMSDMVKRDDVLEAELVMLYPSVQGQKQ